MTTRRLAPPTLAVAIVLSLVLSAASPGLVRAESDGNNTIIDIIPERMLPKELREPKPYRLRVGARIDQDQYRVLPDVAYQKRYGERLRRGHRYVETHRGDRLVVDMRRDVIASVLGDRAIRQRGDDRRDGRKHDGERRGERRGRAIDIPPGHYPPRGSCRLWYPDRPPGHQPPPGPCNVRIPRGAVLIEG